MREIKFRAWDSQDKEMDYDPFCWPTSIDYKDSYCNLNTLISGQFGKVHHGGLPGEDNTHMRYLMQYTGLKDKNGKEIYEGDMLQVNSGQIGVILYHEDRAGFIFQDGYNEMLYQKTHNLEIIGNIHENPELLDSH